MTLPLVRLLQKNFENVSITWIISRPAFDLVETISDIDWVVIEKPNSFCDYWRFWRQMKHRQFDVLLATQASFRANLLYPLITATRKIGYDKLRAKDGHGWFIHETIQPRSVHTLEGFLQFAEPLGILDKTVSWQLPISKKAVEFVDENFSSERPFIIINPHASKPERNWEVEKYCAVIHAVKARWDLDVVLTGGPFPNERAMADTILTRCQGVRNFVGKTKPQQLLAMIAKARFVLCPDTGPSHMGAAVGTPVVALHAVTSSEVSGPWPYRAFCVDCYAEAAQLIFEKASPPWGTHVHSDEAMKLVTVEAVLEKISAVMAL